MYLLKPLFAILNIYQTIFYVGSDPKSIIFYIEGRSSVEYMSDISLGDL